MSYNPTKWTDGTTPLDASNMNKIEDALSDQDSRIDANSDLINTLEDFSDKLTVQSNYTDEVQSVYATKKGGWAIIIIGVKANEGSGTYITIPSGYRPPATVYGFININSGSDQKEYLYQARINTAGNLFLWVRTSFVGPEYIQFVYPIA